MPRFARQPTSASRRPLAALMSEALDANVVLRHFTGQPPAMAARATTALVGAPPRSLVLTDLTVAELVYVLQGDRKSVV